jgi:uncharacterized membrane protein YeaQ/YmgE (transglycosylase-associated protein family)
MYLILALIVIGIAAGWVAERVVYREYEVNWTEAFIAGIAGSFVGGLIANLVAGEGFALHPSGIIGSIIGAIIVLYLWRLVRRGA